MYYINYRYKGASKKYCETVDQFENGIEARLAVQDYRAGDPEGEYWVSTRSTKDWRESKYEQDRRLRERNKEY